MLERPADIGRRRFWIDFHNLGNCYPLLIVEFFGPVLCVTGSLRMIAACGFDKDRGQGPCDAELHRTFGSIVEWAVICLDCCLSQILDIRLAQTLETNGLARFFPCGRPFDKAGFFHPLGCEPQNIGFYFG